MIVQSGVDNIIKLTLGAADCSDLPPLIFTSVRKNTRKIVTIDPFVPTEANARWATFSIDGNLFQIGEHNYQVTGNAVLEKGILIVKDGTEETPQYEGSLEGEKGEYNNRS